MAKKTYAEIQAEIAKLQEEAEAVRQAEVEGVITRMREAIEVYGLTAQDLGLATGSARGSRGPRTPRRPGGAGAASGEPRFRDAEGNVWSGRGPRPKWLREALAAGHQLDEFAVR